MMRSLRYAPMDLCKPKTNNLVGSPHSHRFRHKRVGDRREHKKSPALRGASLSLFTLLNRHDRLRAYRDMNRSSQNQDHESRRNGQRGCTDRIRCSFDPASCRWQSSAFRLASSARTLRIRLAPPAYTQSKCQPWKFGIGLYFDLCAGSFHGCARHNGLGARRVKEERPKSKTPRFLEAS